MINETIWEKEAQALQTKKGFPKEKKKKEVDLEENSFSMVALSTSDSFSARESWICSNILQNLSAFPYSMMNLIPIDAVIVSNFL